MNEVITKIERIRFYLDYVEEHYNNVQKAWEVVKEKCADMFFIQQDFFCSRIYLGVRQHDLSKLSAEEFIQYQERHYPIDQSKMKKVLAAFKIAFKHHKENNFHHVETWTTTKFNNQDEWAIHCVHMIIDWMAMGFKFNDTAYDFYQKVEKNLNLSDEAVDLIDQIFQRLYNKSIFLTEEF